MNPYSDVASNMLLKDRVYNTLKNEIILGHLKPGQRALMEAWGALGKPMAVAALRNPYDLLHLPQGAAGHDGIPHPVTPVACTRVSCLAGGFFKANSYHHQAVGRLAPGLRAAAYADDGQIEALEHESLPILGVQWHPERMVAGLCADTPADHTALFTYLTQRKPQT